MRGRFRVPKPTHILLAKKRPRKRRTIAARRQLLRGVGPAPTVAASPRVQHDEDVTAITPYFVQLVYEAALKSFWRKSALRKFLRQSSVKESFLATWGSEESKRDFLDRLFEKLQATPAGQKALLQMAHHLAEQKTFPDLESWEDSAKKIKDAKATVSDLAKFLRDEQTRTEDEKAKAAAKQSFTKRQEDIRRSKEDLDKLMVRLNELGKRLGTQQAGYDFQTWFYDLLDYSEIVNRRPYVHDGRQIDGSLTVSGTTYLIELKFTREQADAPDVDTFLHKVTSKADNTMGILVSMSGYSRVAIKESSGARTPLLLLDYSHLYFCLTGAMALAEIIDRVRRHASQTGESHLAPSDFGSV
jgi:hypothetical protein